MPSSKSSANPAGATQQKKIVMTSGGGGSASESSLNAGYVPVRQLSGKVAGIWGEAVLRGPDGQERQLKVGDVINKGDVVLTSQNGIVQIEGSRRFADPLPQVVAKPNEPEPAKKSPVVEAPLSDDTLLPGIRVERISEVTKAGAGLAELASPVSRPSAEVSLIEPIDRANPDTVALLEDTSATFDPRTNDNFSSGSVVVQTVAGQVISTDRPLVLPQGTLSMNADGTLSFTPIHDFTGVITVPYTAVGSDGKQGNSVITIAVIPVNDPPVATDDRATVAEDTPLTLDLLGNDRDIDGDVLTIVAINGSPVSAGAPVSVADGAGHVVGTLTLNADRTVTFNPAANYHGPVEFDYTISDGHGGSDTAHVAIDVVSVDDLPVAVSDSFETPQGMLVSGTVGDNDILSGDGGNVFALGAGPANGTLVFNADGTFDYTPNANYNGADSFTYTLTDADGDVSSATVNISVVRPNAMPVAVDDTFSMLEDAVLTNTLVGNDTPSADGGNTYALHTGAANGNVVVNADGIFTYTPRAGFSGADSFSYTLTDTDGDVSTATVRVGVDALPRLSIDSPPAVSEAGGFVEFTVTLTGQSSQPISVTYGTANGAGPNAAIAGQDYTAMTGVLTFQPSAQGTQTIKVQVPITNDTQYEGPETFQMVLSNPTAGAIISQNAGTGVGTIVDDGTGVVPPGGSSDDDRPSLVISNPTVNEGAGFAVFTLTLSNTSKQDTTVSLALTDGTATGGAVDYGTVAGNVANLQVSNDNGQTWTSATTAIIGAGQTQVQVRTPITDDQIDEVDETFKLTATVTGGVVTPATTRVEGEATIADNDGAPTLSIDSPPAVSEAGGFVEFTVTLTGQSSQPISVTYGTANGAGPNAAIAGQDYTAMTGVLTFQPSAQGTQTIKVQVPITNDTQYEGPETFQMVLSNPTAGAIIGQNAGTGVGTIVDDGTGVVPPGGSSDDDRPSLVISNPTVNEGAGFAVFTLTLSNTSKQDTTVSLALTDGTATGGAVDYGTVAGNVANLQVSNDNGQTWTSATTAIIGAGQTQVQVRTPITDDQIDEVDETFKLTATVTGGVVTPATTRVEGEATIADNDGAPTLSIDSPPAVSEAGGFVEFTVTLTGQSSQPISVTYGTANGAGPNAAIAGQDYTAMTGVLTFQPSAQGTQTIKVQVPITNDTQYEGPETFQMVLSNPTAGAIIGQNAGTGVGTIVDDGTGVVPPGGSSDDDRPSLVISNPTVNEGAGFAVFTLTLSNTSKQDTTVSLALTDGTATGGAVDYGTVAGNVANLQVSNDNGQTWTSATTAIIGAGQTQVQVRTPITDDQIDEVDETFKLTATVTGGVVTPATTRVEGEATIADNDGAPTLSIDSPPAVSEAGGFVEFTVTLTGQSSQPISVTYGTANGAGPNAAIAGQDYTAMTGVLTFQPSAQGTQTIKVQVPITNDTQYEGPETFQMVLSNPTAGAIIGQNAGTGVGTIVDDGTGVVPPGGSSDDDRPSLVISNPTVNEGAGFAVFTLTLSNTSKQDTTVSLALTDGTATGGAVDYGTVAGNVANLQVSNDNGQTWTSATTAIIGAGQTQVQVRTPITDDQIDEVDETFKLTATVTGGVVTPATTRVEGEATIADNDGAPTLSIDSPPAVSEAGGFVEFTVTLTGQSSQPISVTYGTANGAGPNAAIAGQDYTAMTGVLTFQPSAQGTQTIKVQVPITNDTQYEGPETFQMVLSNPTAGAIIGQNAGTGVGTIVDDGTGVVPPGGSSDDDRPSLVISNPTVNEGAGFAVFTLTLSNTSKQDTTVSLALTDGTATGGAVDYGTVAGNVANLQVSNDNGQTWTSATTAIIGAGQTQVQVRTPITDDQIDEVDETFKLTATVTGGVVTPATTRVEGEATIADNDGAPTLSIDSPPAVSEAGGFVEFTVTLTGQSSQPISVTYGTANGAGPNAAIAGQDYTAMTGVLTFQPSAQGTQTIKVQVPITNDTQYEGPETFQMVLSNPTAGAIIGQNAGTGVGTIVDDGTGVVPPGGSSDDDRPSLVISNPTVNEGAGFAVFTLTLSNTSKQDTTVSLALTDGTATGGAVDYGTVAGNVANLQVSNDNGQTWTSATTAIIGAGQTQVQVRTPITDDQIDEVDETFKLTATVTGGVVTPATTRVEGEATIADNDGAPTLSIDSPPAVSEAGGFVEFTVTLTGQSSQPISVTYGTANGAGPNAAIAGQDYTAMTGVLTFQPSAQGTQTIKVQVPITNDTQYEGPETFQMVLSNPTAGAIIGQNAGTGVGTIVDDGTGVVPPGGSSDDDRPSLVISNPTVNEGAGFAVFTLTLSNTSKQDTTVSLALTDGTATGGAVDYGTVAGNVANLQVSNDNGQTWTSATTAIIGAGQTQVQVRTPITDDQIDEVDETFKLTATVTGGVVTPATTRVEGEATIADNDGAPTLSIDSPPAVSEAGGFVEFTVTLTGQSSQPISVTYGTANGAGPNAAIAGQDYTAMTGVLTFQPSAQGTQTIKVQVPITNDTQYEGPETFQMVLSNPTAGAIIGQNAGTGVGTIVDDGTGVVPPGGSSDDDRPSLVISNPTVNEGAGFAVFTLTLSNTSKQDTTVSLALTDGTATGGAVDYGTVAGNVANLQVSNDNGQTWTSATTAIIGAGQTQVQVRTPITDDQIDEVDETFKLTATVTGGVVTPATTRVEGEATIADNDGAPTLSIDSPPAVSEAGGFVEFTVTLTGQSSQPISVTYGTANGAGPNAAIAGQDYTAMTGVLTFQPSAQGTQTIKVQVPITNDTQYEGPETFQMVLSNPTAGAIIGQNAGTGVGTIVDDGTGVVPPGGSSDDDRPSLVISNPTVNEGAGFAVFTLTLSNTSKQDTTVSLALTDGTATGGAVDYGTVAGNVANLQVSNDNGQTWTSATTAIIGAGQTQVQVRTPITDDQIDEVDETFKLTATVTGGVVTPATTRVEGEATIADNDGAPTLSIDSPPAVSEAGGFVEFTVTLTGQSSQPISVTYGTANGAGPNAAIAGQDYTAMTGVLTFQPSAQGTQTIKVQVPITNDTQYEGPETFQMVLSNPTAGAIIGQNAGTGVGTIVDDGTGVVPPGGSSDDDRPSLVISNPTVNEGAGFAVFTLTLSNTSKQDTTVSLALTDGTATGGAVDYGTVAGNVANLQVSNDNGQTWTSATTAIIGAGQTQVQVRTPITDDQIDEVDETFKLTATVTGGVVTPATTRVEGEATIADNDGAPSLGISDLTVAEDGGHAEFTVTLTNPSSQDISLALTLADGTALGSGTDYGSVGVTNLEVSTDGGTTWVAAATATIAAGSTSLLVRTPIVDDQISERNEQFTLRVDAAPGTTANGTVTGTGTITDNDPPELRVTGESVNENDAFGHAVFTVSLSNAVAQPVVVTLTLGQSGPGGDTATKVADYGNEAALEYFDPNANGGMGAWVAIAAGGQLTIPANTLAVQVRTPIVNDVIDEGDETFTLTATPVVPNVTTNASASDFSTINDNDTQLVSTTTVAVTGLRGEYYGYNTAAAMPAGYNSQAFDGLVPGGGNIDTAAKAIALINGRQGSSIVGTGIFASAAATDAIFNSTNVFYDRNPPTHAVNNAEGLGGSNPTSSANQQVTSGSVYDFLNANGATGDGSSLTATSTFGRTQNGVMRIVGQVLITETGDYRLNGFSDDGFAVYIDGVQRLDLRGAGATTPNPPIVNLTEGYHNVEIIYYEWATNAALEVSLTPVDSPATQILGLSNYAMFQQTPVLTDLQDIIENPTVDGQYLIRTGQENSGTAGDDTIFGSDGRDKIHGLGGNDTLTGGGGADQIDGGDGNDVIDGGAGDDQLNGDAGNDTLISGAGRDTLNGGDGDDLLRDTGATQIKGRYIRIYHTYASSAAQSALALTELEVWATKNGVSTNVAAGLGATGGVGFGSDTAPQNVNFDGANRFAALTDGQGQGLNYNGGNSATSNIAYLRDGNTGNHAYFTVDLGSSYDIEQLLAWGRGDQISQSQSLRFVISDTPFSATDTYASLSANPNVTILDTLGPTAGATGQATLMDPPQADTFNGGNGIDTLDYSDSAAALRATVSKGVNVDLAAGTADKWYGSGSSTIIDTLISIENVTGTAQADRLSGDTGSNVLNGGRGNDVLLGQGGNDTLIGGAGNDTLTGGIGADTFRWELADRGTGGAPAVDTISDFNTADYANGTGGDRLDLRDLLQGESATAVSLDNYLSFQRSGSDTVIRISSTGQFPDGGYSAGVHDQTITLQNVDLTANSSLTAQQIIQSLLDQQKLLAG
ncbi:Calx-beta domain-containing protein [Variovorax sp. KK3]|uniref:Calx-beta domain-containing protein n=3 Tax=Variovorax sp. KK3 TaxID=1855728 RepID=UPI003AAF5459